MVQTSRELCVYTITYWATDASGNTTLATTQVGVPHDKSLVQTSVYGAVGYLIDLPAKLANRSPSKHQRDGGPSPLGNGWLSGSPVPE